MALASEAPPADKRPVDRRGFLGITSIAIATILVGVAMSGRRGFAAALTKEQRDRLTPDDIIAGLREREAMGLDEVTLLPAMAEARQTLKDFAEQVIRRY